MKSPTHPGIGVIVGRFQVAELHPGHRYLIETALAAHDQVLVVIGSTRGLPSARHPLSYPARRAMIQKSFPNIIVREQFDHPSDHRWSLDLDQLIATVAGGCPATLYGARDSFIPFYHGRYPVIILPEVAGHSGTKNRAALAAKIGTSRSWRSGVIHTLQHRPPLTYSSVDVAVLKPGEVLLAEKRQDAGKLRFIGGFVDTTDHSDEAAARRELYEEAGAIETAHWQYLGSTHIDDWRYRGTPDRIMTRFFASTYVFGRPTAGDDIDHLHWVPQASFLERLIPSHAPLGKLLTQFLMTIPNP
jgi:bifunctional NMN adenylyltransferase/nudix hydrolase